MPKSSNAIYLLFEQCECLRVTKLFSWARSRNSSQPGTKTEQATRDSWIKSPLSRILSPSSLTWQMWFKFSFDTLLTFSCFQNFPSDSWQYQYYYWSGRHWTNMVIISLSWEGAAGDSTGGHRRPGQAGVTSRSLGLGKWELKHWQLMRPRDIG